MEKLVLPYDLECMKIVMLKHEETFKQQVYELHRLYEIQRMLMKNMQRKNQETWSSKNGTKCFGYQNDYDTLSDPRKQDPIDGNGGLDESEIELTLGPKSYTCRRSKSSFIGESASDSMTSFSSSITSSSDHKSQVSLENLRQVDRLLDYPSWLRQVLI